MVLQKFHLTTLCMQTINNWMHHFGFKYKPRWKTFYVDGHEKKEETVAYRNEIITHYLRREIQCFRWIQLPLHRVIELKKKYIEFNRKDAYEYQNKQLIFFEFHVDYHDCLSGEWEELGLSEPEFGGNLSVRKKEDEKPIIIFGQDECIFKQFLFSHSHWALPDGTELEYSTNLDY